MIGVDVFAGAGGMALGARWAGIDVRIAIEMKAETARTHARNHPRCLIINADMRHVAGFLNGYSRNEQLVLFGGPPCQAFSTSNQRTRGPQNDKNLLYREFLRMTIHLKPHWVVFENVPGILEGNSRKYVEHIKRTLNKIGYGISAGVLDAADFGVPQHRKRFFIIGARDTDGPPLPIAKVERHITVGEAINDLPILRNGAEICRLPYSKPAISHYAHRMRRNRTETANNLVSYNAEYVIRRYKHIPQGGNWSDIPAHLMRNYADRYGCHTGIYHRLRSDQPSVVIGNFRKNMLIHPTQNRGLSVREAARLQSFPDWYEFDGSIGLQQQQVGNAVPPLLAKAIFETVMKAAKRG